MRRIGLLLVTAATLTACSEPSAGQIPAPPNSPGPASSAAKAIAPGLKIETVAGGLEHGWDMGFLPDGKVLVTQRPGKLALISSTKPGAQVTQVQADFSDVLVAGEGGLMGMVLEPDFAQTRQFITCQTYKENGAAKDIRLIRWRLSPDGRSAERVGVLLSGLPVARGGRHSGCRPTVAPDGSLLVGTGDTANPKPSQDRTNLGGKVLKLDIKTGGPAPGNPFINAQNANEKRVYTYGHRNVQGVAVRPGSAQIITAEHGPDKNDEINIEISGKNYGWDPSKGGTENSYDESVPMTDLKRFPDAVPALWESGETTEAVCAAAFLSGTQWGDLDGSLVVTALKGAKAMLFKLDDAGKVQSVSIPPEFNDAFGRLRAARTGPDGALYITTSNGTDDKLLRVTRG
ncbi:glucose/arabinose dehydrogenase [Kibdelosporangium banguiense]|uniref:Glucose/arabinose dehydrogenase n=1 Tax=Kibdelosporangium banguiense TaxID=1365924 RepID=A0ABS4T958_9PSEU|nr:PQQ-dependent sugar dehydrogenase [Kibdelosporangium banguiense]MBP2320957.1 glucose/arabinose dehydrogenase [Kibdelosporangium banguiense]